MATKAGPGRQTAGAFDIRLIISALFFLYGLVLTVMGLVATSEEDLAKSADFNINLWTGIGMLIFAVLFAGWVQWRPIVVSAGESEGDSAS